MHKIKQEAEVTTSTSTEHKLTEDLAWQDKGGRRSVFQEKHDFPPGFNAEL